jgi:hypothetical protein
MTVDAILEAIDALDDEDREWLLENLHDKITKHLDAFGWMIVCQPQNYYPGAVWFLDKPSKRCPAWCRNGLDGKAPKLPKASNIVPLRPL